MLRREISIFLLIGSTSVLIDFLIYSSLIHSAEVGVGLAKASSFLVGVLFTYFANRFWTFGHTTHQPDSLLRYGCLYIFTLSVNVIVNTVALRLLREVHVAALLAFLAATGISASLNFLGLKWFVFRPGVAPEDR